MPFEADEFYVGMIAYFTVNQLRRHRRILSSAATRDNKPRPFVCYAQEGGADGESYWTYLTGTPHPQRRTVDRKWLRAPAGRFALLSSGHLIIGDGRNTFVGPIGAFAECSRKHDEFKGMYRPMLVAQGVDEVQMIVGSRGGLMPPAPAPHGRPAQAAA